jgi:hypothetical protein
MIALDFLDVCASVTWNKRSGAKIHVLLATGHYICNVYRNPVGRQCTVHHGEFVDAIDRVVHQNMTKVQRYSTVAALSLLSSCLILLDNPLFCIAFTTTTRYHHAALQNVHRISLRQSSFLPPVPYRQSTLQLRVPILNSKLDNNLKVESVDEKDAELEQVIELTDEEIEEAESGQPSQWTIMQQVNNVKLCRI